jgi:hypothetical protein
MCIKAGDHATAEWWSFGGEPPVSYSLDHDPRFPRDFMFVVRPAYID